MTKKKEDQEEQEPLFKPQHKLGILKQVALDELPPNSELIGFAPEPSLVRDVRENGIRVPVILEKCDPHKVTDPDAPTEGRWVHYIVRDGRRRIRAARLAELTKVKAEVFVAGTLDASVTVVTNALRDDNPAAEYMAVIELAKAAKKSPTEIGQALGLPKARVQRLMRFDGLVPRLKKAFLDGRIRATAAFEAVKLSKSAQGKLANLLEKDGKLTTHTVLKARQAAVRKENASLPGEAFETPGAEAVEEFEPKWPIETAGHEELADGNQALAFARRAFIVRDSEGVHYEVFPIVTGVRIGHTRADDVSPDDADGKEGD